MSLLRSLFAVGVSVSLLACGTGDEDSYVGAPPLSKAQSLKAATAMGKSDKMERAIDVVTGDKEADQDIADIVELISQCEVHDSSTIGDDYIDSEVRLIGDNCPVAYRKHSHIEVKEVDGELEMISGYEEVSYSTTNDDVLNVVDIRSADFRVDFNSDGTYSLKANVDFVSIGVISINDRLSITQLGTSVVEYNFFRTIHIDGFVVEARVKLVIDWSTGQLKDRKFIINGKFVGADEMAALYPIPFEWFTDGKRFKKPKP